MPNVNIDVLKQTLDHFAEQEALAEGEIQQAEEKIVELEARIVDCHERLKTVESDRDHVMEIMQRYASKATGSPEAKAPAKTEKTESKPAATASKAQQQTSTGTAKPIKEPPKAATKSQPAAEEKKAEEPAAEGDDDTVKNINDALRGLFR